MVGYYLALCCFNTYLWDLTTHKCAGVSIGTFYACETGIGVVVICISTSLSHYIWAVATWRVSLYITAIADVERGGNAVFICDCIYYCIEKCHEYDLGFAGVHCPGTDAFFGHSNL